LIHFKGVTIMQKSPAFGRGKAIWPRGDCTKLPTAGSPLILSVASHIFLLIGCFSHLVAWHV